MLHMQHGIQRHNVSREGHFSINNGQERKTLLTPIILAKNEKLHFKLEFGTYLSDSHHITSTHTSSKMLQ